VHGPGHKKIKMAGRWPPLSTPCPMFMIFDQTLSMLNTQGGPRRNARGQIVRPASSTMPRIYSAGELGSIYSYLYQGTGNIGECLSFGRISGRNAAAEQPWG
jgi:hypothetical protein